MKTVSKKLLSLLLVAILLVSTVPFQVFATEGETTADPTETTAATEASVETTAATEAPAETTTATEAPAETTAATEAPLAPASVEDAANVPATMAITDTAYIKFVIADAANNPDACVKTVETKIGAKISGVPNATEVMNRYAQIFGTSTGKQFSHWALINDPNAVAVNTGNTYVTDTNAPNGVLYLYAIVIDKAQNINLIANGGSVSPTTIQAVVGGTYPTLPTPTRTHYEFDGWFVTINGIEHEVMAGDTVYDASPLKAHWVTANYYVEFQKYDGANWVGVKSFNVPANSVLTTANGYFPTDAEIAANYALSGYTIVGWEIGETDTAFKAGSTKITQNGMIIRPRYQRTVTLMANNPNAYTSNSIKSITVEIGEPIPSLPNPGARNGYTFVDWVSEDQTVVISTKANLSNTSAHPNYDPAKHGTTFYARWTESVVVYLYIHTNGNTQTATKIVPYYEAPATGAFNMNLVNMYSIFPSYGDYDDDVDTSYGWYSKSEWKNYSAGTASTWANNVFYDVGSNPDYQELHIMLINNGGSSSSSSSSNNYNNNSSTADSSNPTTGDYIFMAVTVMALSAAALGVIFFMKKRKASK